MRGFYRLVHLKGVLEHLSQILGMIRYHLKVKNVNTINSHESLSFEG